MVNGGNKLAIHLHPVWLCKKAWGLRYLDWGTTKEGDNVRNTSMIHSKITPGTTVWISARNKEPERNLPAPRPFKASWNQQTLSHHLPPNLVFFNTLLGLSIPKTHRAHAILYPQPCCICPTRTLFLVTLILANWRFGILHNWRNCTWLGASPTWYLGERNGDWNESGANSTSVRHEKWRKWHSSTSWNEVAVCSNRVCWQNHV